MTTEAPVSRFTVQLELVDGYEFRVRFDKAQLGELTTDEPPPLGRDAGPNPARLLAAAVANCLAASLLFSARRAKVPVLGITADVDATMVRNERKRLRIGRMDVTLRPRVEGGPVPLGSCLEEFEDFCVVTQSVRQGLDVQVHVEPE
jgi:uncharacterized OsmC-like protein